MPQGDDVIRCSFCSRTAHEVTSMVAGSGDVYICDRCIHDASGIVRGDLAPYAAPSSAGGRRPTERRSQRLVPRQIKAALDEHVIGQDAAKRTLSVAVYNHYKRIEAEEYLHGYDDVEVEKSNILLLGPSGTGKTLLARTLARVLDVPFSIADATALTEAGYVGEDVESILSHLLQAADYDVERAERGIIYVDEIDKLSRKGDNASITRDVSGEGVQQALLKMLEGTVAGVPPKGGRKHPEQSLVQFDTRNVLFICGGAFDGLAAEIARRRSHAAIGFSVTGRARVEPTDPTLFRHAEPDDLLRFGLIPELVGRLPVLTALDGLTPGDLRRILTEPKNALVRQYQKLFAMDGVDLVFDDDAFDAVVEEALSLKTGARGLRAVLEGSMQDLMFDAPDVHAGSICRVTASTITDGTPPVVEERKASA